MAFANGCNSCNGALHSAYLCLIWTWNMTCDTLWCSCIAARRSACLFLIWARSMTLVNWRNSCIWVQHSVYLCRINSRNMTPAHRRNSCIGVPLQSIRVENSLETWLAPRETLQADLWFCHLLSSEETDATYVPAAPGGNGTNRTWLIRP